jgi:hypothetical protein
MPNYVDPRQQMLAMTMDAYSPWTQMMLGQEVPGPGAPGMPPPFVPIPVPIAVPTPKTSSTTADPEPSYGSDKALMDALMKPYNKGWRDK